MKVVGEDEGDEGDEEVFSSQSSPRSSKFCCKPGVQKISGLADTSQMLMVIVQKVRKHLTELPSATIRLRQHVC